MPERSSRRRNRRLLVLFVAATLLLTAAFAWLSSRLLLQERALERQRVQERLEHAADLANSSLLRSVSAADATLLRLVNDSPERLESEASLMVEGMAPDSLLVVVAPESVRVFPAGRLLYYPPLPTPNDGSSPFAEGERLEFGEGRHAAAADLFAAQARLDDPAVRGGALLRLARNLRKSGRSGEALTAYVELSKLGSTRVENVPAELLGLYGRCTLFEQQKQTEELELAAQELFEGLMAGAWPIERSAWLFYRAEATRWLGLGTPPAPSEERVALAEAVEDLWRQWRSGILAGELADGLRVFSDGNRSLLVQWRSGPQRLVARISGPRQFERGWSGSIGTLPIENLTVRLMDPRQIQAADAAATGRILRAVRTTSDIGLPWPLHLSIPIEEESLIRSVDRHRLLILGVGAMMSLFLIAGYLTARAVNRELEVARLQSDFVSAVSHEFRSPLSTLRQMSEMLSEGRVGEEARNRYYGQLQWEVRRLQRLVENLLDFGRMEAGVRPYRLEPVALPQLVEQIAGEFQREVAERGYRIDLAPCTRSLVVRADREAIGQALWNLLENAAKYSPVQKSIQVRCDEQDGLAAIAVEDRGLGVNADERELIFSKFTRGSSARATGAKGTGLGLAMVSQIIEGHGGSVRLNPTPGGGSTFTILLPLEVTG